MSIFILFGEILNEILVQYYRDIILSHSSRTFTSSILNSKLNFKPNQTTLSLAQLSPSLSPFIAKLSPTVPWQFKMLHPHGDDSIEMLWISVSLQGDYHFKVNFTRGFIHQNVMHSWKRLTFEEGYCYRYPRGYSKNHCCHPQSPCVDVTVVSILKGSRFHGPSQANQTWAEVSIIFSIIRMA